VAFGTCLASFSALFTMHYVATAIASS